MTNNGRILDSRWKEVYAESFGNVIQEPIRARLGNPTNGQIAVPLSDTDVPDSFWLHGLGEDSQGIGIAINAGGIAPRDMVFGAPVLLKSENGRYIIQRLDNYTAAEYFAGVARAEQSQVEVTQIMWGTIQPTQPASMRARVRGAVYSQNDTLYPIADQDTADFSTGTVQDTTPANITLPTVTGQAKGVLVQIDATTGTLSYKQGAQFDAELSHQQAFDAGFYPARDTERFAIGYLRMVKGITTLTGAHLWNTPEYLTAGATGVEIHTHEDNDNGGFLDADAINTGILDAARLPGMAGAINGSNDGTAGIVSAPVDGQQYLFWSGGASFAQPVPLNFRQGYRLKVITVSRIGISEGSILVSDDGSVNPTLVQENVSQTLDLATAGNWIGGSSTEAASSWISVYVDRDNNFKLHNKLPTFGIDQNHRMTALVNQSGWNGTAGSGLNATAVVYDGDTGEGNLRIGQLVGIYASTDTDYSSGRGKGSAAGASVNNWSWARLTTFNTGTNTLTLEAGHNIAIFDNDRIVVIDDESLAYREESSVWYRWLGAIFNDSGSNLVADRRHNFARTFQDNDTNYTISATAFPNAVDTTNLAGDILTNGGNLKIEMHGATSIASNSSLAFDVSINGVLLNTQAANTAGIQRFGQGATGVGMGFPVNLAPEITVLPGAHHAEIHAIRITANNTLSRGGSGSASALEFKMSEVQDTS